MTKIYHDFSSNRIVFHDLQRSISQQSSTVHVHTRTNAKVEATVVSPDTCETTVRTEDAFLDCVIIDEAVLSYQYCSTDST